MMRTQFRRVWATILLLAVVGLQLTRALAQENVESSAITFRVMTYNIHHAEGLDGKVNVERIAKLITENKADVVALQEVDRGVERTARRDLPAELAKLTGMTAVFSNNFHFQGGEYGNAILSRFPVKRWTNRHYKMLRTGEQRGILQAVLEVKGQELVFMNTHIDHRPDDSERLMNVKEIAEVLQQYPKLPAMLCGDFNDVPDSRTCQNLAKLLDDSWAIVGEGPGFSIPVEKPRKRIDYIWISKGKTLRPLKMQVLCSEASDHLPVLGEFKLTPGKG